MASTQAKERAMSMVFMAITFGLLGAFIGACATYLVLSKAQVCFAGHWF